MAALIVFVAWRRMSPRGQIRDAVKARQTAPVYQPVIGLATGRSLMNAETASGVLHAQGRHFAKPMAPATFLACVGSNHSRPDALEPLPQ